MTTPALRFTEFDGDWISSPLKKFFPKIRNGFVGIATPYYVANGVKYLQGKNVKDGRIDPTGLIYISEEFHAKKSNSKLAIDDILMVQSGHVGECAVIDKEYDNANCHALIVLSPHKEQETNSHFVKYYFYTPIGKKIISQIKTGNTIEHVLASEVKEIYLNFPSKVEQTKIASFLSIVDEKIAQLSQKHQLLSQYKEGMMQKLFSQQIRFKADDGSEFEEWEITTLGLTGKFIGGGTPSKKVTEFWQGSIPWISSSDLVDESIFNINITRFISTEALNQSATKLIPANSILIVSRVGVGKVAVTDKDICTSQDFTNLVLNSGNTVFFGYLIKSLTGRLLEMNQGTSIKGFVKDDLSTLKVQIPCLEEQLKIANLLSSFDQKIDIVLGQLEQAKQWKKGLLQQMFV
jgi:type I restriction enzyme S subunit